MLAHLEPPTKQTFFRSGPAGRRQQQGTSGFIFVQHLSGFTPVLAYGNLLFVHASTNATDDHKYSPLPSVDFDIAEVLVSFSAIIFSKKNVPFDFERAF